ncbi:MAG: hypothetical protein BHV69_05290 [Bacteroidales bacterium 52_46]|nr:MAG: hypothetical protein BHV69_05290 [Bacteroidales bacterium 52_46]
MVKNFLSGVIGWGIGGCGDFYGYRLNFYEKKFQKYLVVEEKVHTFALAFGKQASFRGEKTGR